jgi:hypothetical protein
VLPPLAIAVHAAPRVQPVRALARGADVLMLAVMPPLIWFVYRRSESGLEGWLSTASTPIPSSTS